MFKYWPFYIFGAIILIAAAGPLLYRYDPYAINLLAEPLPPGWKNLFGTDLLGRDILARVLHGAKFSLWIGFSATVFSISLGAVIGIISGFQKQFDYFLNPIITLFLGFPYLLLTIAIASTLKPGLLSIFIALAISGWAGTARLIRSEVLGLKEELFVWNLRGLGASIPRILFLHILPNCFPTLCVIFFTHFATTILAESSLSFIGLGLQSPTPSWGKMIYEGADYIRIAPWWSFFPGLCLTLSVLSLNCIGDFLREKFHVKMQ